jgi:hypothetical protein
LIYAVRSTNTVNIVNKLVTIFASNLDSFIVTENHLNHLFYTVTSGSGQITAQMTLFQFAGTLQKLRHTLLATGTNSRLKKRDIWPDSFTG